MDAAKSNDNFCAVYMGGRVVPSKELRALNMAVRSVEENTMAVHRKDMSRYLPNRTDQIVVTCEVPDVISQSSIVDCLQEASGRRESNC